MNENKKRLLLVWISAIISISCLVQRQNADESRWARENVELFPFLSDSEVDSIVEDRTLRLFDVSHGNQIVFFSLDGRTFLWYPGQTTMINGYWKVIKNRLLCLYYTDQILPSTTEPNDDWNCFPLHLYKSNIQESASGNRYDLAWNGKTPFILLRYPETNFDLIKKEFSKKSFTIE
ncbi:hypothetical protein [Leptospira stimsonii]|uniref:Lipoprotein n=1 Tax=Leptospira stimsonii TaxID=2202203 RepID=A0A8B3CRN4_9LEPT|nr:hypothetical protein [Leptospira stimsonii]RHX86632.1 hypothetical protein DLM78_12660 [Leptospira stimsonii]